jgi:hypothetical protein
MSTIAVFPPQSQPQRVGFKKPLNVNNVVFHGVESDNRLDSRDAWKLGKHTHDGTVIDGIPPRLFDFNRAAFIVGYDLVATRPGCQRVWQVVYRLFKVITKVNP